MPDPQQKKNYNSVIEDNIIFPANLTNSHLVVEFINSLNRLVYKFNHKEIIIDCCNVGYVLPMPIVPIAGIIHYFKEKEGIAFKFKNLNNYLRYSNFNHPKQISSTSIIRSTNLFDKIWIFSDSREINQIATSFTSLLMGARECGTGVIHGSIWAINEVLDNVIQHSGLGRGFVMAQLNKARGILNVCIYDYGSGIYKTLSGSEFKPRSAVDAITLCIKEGVTRDKNIGQGNGLWGLYNIISQNTGILSIISGRGGIVFSSGQPTKIHEDIVLLNKINQSTTVSFSLNLDRGISMKDALKGYDTTDMYIENLKGDFGDIIYKLSNLGTGTGTRESGLLMKNEVLNIYKSVNSRIIIDFDGIGIVSSSFIDEFIGKLIDNIGFYQYQSIFRLINMNRAIQPIFEAALKKRIGGSAEFRNS
jgi:hypothetical protein